MNKRELKALLVDKIVELIDEATPSDIMYLSNAYEVIQRADRADPYESMSKAFSSALSTSPFINKGFENDN